MPGMLPDFFFRLCQGDQLKEWVECFAITFVPPKSWEIMIYVQQYQTQKLPRDNPPCQPPSRSNHQIFAYNAKGNRWKKKQGPFPKTTWFVRFCLLWREEGSIYEAFAWLLPTRAVQQNLKEVCGAFHSYPMSTSLWRCLRKLGRLGFCNVCVLASQCETLSHFWKLAPHCLQQILQNIGALTHSFSTPSKQHMFLRKKRWCVSSYKKKGKQPKGLNWSSGSSNSCITSRLYWCRPGHVKPFSLSWKQREKGAMKDKAMEMNNGQSKWCDDGSHSYFICACPDGSPSTREFGWKWVDSKQSVVGAHFFWADFSFCWYYACIT